ncbi:ubiquitin specific protease 47 isoform X2 [Halictus rubicundus]|uniref:ubiquitin specific protease 47 isoform X2 n=1 Tax=Halictus rubicundus TaxID=77578 RepID=UPI0040355890
MGPIIHSCPIEFFLPHGTVHKNITNSSYTLVSTTSVKNLYEYIEKHYQIQADNFKLYLGSPGKLIDLSEVKDKVMSEIDVGFSNTEDLVKYKYTLLVVRPTDTLVPGIFGPHCVQPEPLHQSLVLEEDNNVDFKSSIRPETGYVGLVNQAMTCYLNSLIQALYMTPEFRNALYNWEYTGESEKDETISIPYQLQKLFLNLQTSSRSAVETTALTKSFGWDSTEAWQQHDIQELCRVMFEALERKFKNTEQADLINKFYEGAMIDYVKCLECGTEKSREDTFLDIPLPVRPFGSNVAYSSVEEALRAFVQYETLEGNNQYHCEKCNKKCDAHKGLKFIKFPYLLTLHLKRFDFDFNTFRRVKLNDKVTFPNILNLNQFILPTTNEESTISEKNTNLAKSDDSSTIDFGTLDDDYTPCENNLSNSNHTKNNDPDDDDEGVDDLSNGPTSSNCTEHNYEDDKNRDNAVEGPYNYELFSIMIHSGSASGGHYYAYIKDFRTQEWLCFNDQTVTQITNDDIQKTYGGGPTRSYYSGPCSSTNAYMLMYRQIDPARNVLPMQVQDFPSHIQKLLKKMKEMKEMKENADYKRRDDRPSCLPYPREHFVSRKEIKEPPGGGFNRKDKLAKMNCKFIADGLSFSFTDYEVKPCSLLKRKPTIEASICCVHSSKMHSLKMKFLSDITWSEATKTAWQMFDLSMTTNLKHCRLVLYDSINKLVLCRYEGMEQKSFADVWKRDVYTLMLEIRDENELAVENEQNVITAKVYVLDVAEKKITEGPLKLRALRTQQVSQYKKVLSDLFDVELNKMTVILGEPGSQLRLFDYDESTLLSNTDLSDNVEVFVMSMCNDEWKSFVEKTTLCDIISNYTNHENILTFHLKLPDPSKVKEISDQWIGSTLGDRCTDTERPTAESPSKGNNTNSQPQRDGTPKSNPVLKIGISNEDVSGKYASPQLGENEKWNTPEQSNSEDSSLSDSDKTLVGDALEFDDFNEPYRPFNTNVETDDKEYYFKATPYEDIDNQFLKVEVSRKMKYSMLKTKLEPYIGVPKEYFKISYKSEDLEDSAYYKLQENLLIREEDEYFTVKVGRFFDFTIKIYRMFTVMETLFHFLGAWILSRDITVAEAKKDILKNIKDARNIDIPLKRCRLREKHLSLATRVYLDHQKLDELHLHPNSEMVIQKLSDNEPVTNTNQIIVRVANMDIHEGYQEIVMDEKSTAEMRKLLSAVTTIPEEHIEIAKANNKESDETKLTWHGPDSDVELDIDNGFLFFYRDSRYKRDLSKTSSREESSVAKIQEMRDLNTRSRRKERALRIYLTSTE